MPEEIFETPQPVAETKSFDRPNMILAAVLGLGLLAAAAYAGYWYGTESANLKTQSAKPQPNTQISEIPTPKLTPTTEPALPVAEVPQGWKVYKSATHKYAVLIPDNWSGYESELKDLSGSTIETYIETYFGEVGQKTEDFIVISVKDNTGSLSIKEWAEQQYRDITGGLEPETDILKFTDVIVGSERAAKVTGIPARFADVYVFIPHGGKMFEILGVTDPMFNKAEAFNQILSTFKFLD